MKEKKSYIKKIIFIFILIVGLAAALFVLTHPAKNGFQSETFQPKVTDTPVYITIDKNTDFYVDLCPDESFYLGSIQVFLVNVSKEDKGFIHFELTDNEGALVSVEEVPTEDIPSGEWKKIAISGALQKGEHYELHVIPNHCVPYFMKLPSSEKQKLPTSESVFVNGEVEDCAVSLGIEVVSDIRLTYGDIFYYSVPLCVLLFILAALLVWFGKEKCISFVRNIPFVTIMERFGSDLFLVLVFAVQGLKIYVEGYAENIYISADSAGYMREAVNLVSGNGFHYDGLAGYHNWFANWPILYPALIAGMMKLFGVNVYLASKIVSIVVVFAILAVLRACFKKDAWIYALCLANTGFLNLAYYTWSEVPFILFLLLFGFALSGILKREKVGVKDYVLLSLAGLGTFLTRYIGIYVWFVAGVYILLLGLPYVTALIADKKKQNPTDNIDEKLRAEFHKAVGITVTSLISGLLSMGYLLLNKVMNGAASGVDRSLWWDDYESLTNDLIQSMLIEFCNVFAIEVPSFINKYSYAFKTLIVWAVLIGLGIFIWKNGTRKSRSSVFIAMAVIYYAVFIVIRYFSSMDSFYFRFFEPATFLFTMGIIGLILPKIKGSKGTAFFAFFITLLFVIEGISLLQSNSLKNHSPYIYTMEETWNQEYAQIPERSVVVFSTLDYRSTFFRPDVVEGEIKPEDTMEDLRTRYYGSKQMCILASDAEVMVEEGDYCKEVKENLRNGLNNCSNGEKYIIVGLR